jgi:hypothetical protein
MASIALWPLELTPAVATLIAPGLAFIASMSSVAVLYGVFGFTPSVERWRRKERPVADLGVEHAEDGIGAEVLGRAGRPRVAILRGFERILRADRARRAGLVDDDDFLPEYLLDFGGRHAGDLVGRAAGRPRHDDGDRLRRLPLLR